MNKDLNYYFALPWSRIFIKNEDGSYLAQIKELKGCTTEGEDIQDAHDMLEDALKAWIQIALEDNQTIPEPGIDELSEYSGKFNIRIPKSIHKELVKRAEKENVSLNNIVNMLLTKGLASSY